MKEHNILTDEQSVFRQYHSTEKTVLNLTNEWFGYTLNKSLIIMGVLFLDLKMAFDTVNRKILLTKLEMYGIRGFSLEWFKSYFMSRKQVCAINGKLSDEKQIHCGVPQGSNLGPFCFFYILMICLTASEQLRPNYLSLTDYLFHYKIKYGRG